MTQQLKREVPPIVLTQPSAIDPHAYRLIIRHTHCTRCDKTHESSELYQINSLKSRVMQKPGITNAIPTDYIAWNIPFQVATISHIRQMPVCHECFETLSLNHLPTLPSKDVELMHSPPRATEDGPGKASHASRGRKVLSAEDL